jgi:hypothetical protein
MDRNIRRLWLILVIVGFCFFPLHETIAADCTETFSWLPNSESNIAGYRIYYGQTHGGPYPNVVNVGKPEPVDDRIYGQVAELTCGQQYYFVCTAVDDTGSESAYSDQIELIPCANVYTKTFSGADFPQTCKDTFLNVGEAGVNYSSNSESIKTYTWPTNTAANRIVMKWDLSALPQDAIIQEATLSLYMYSYGGDDNYEITAHKIINHNPDISSCTWNTYDDTNSWTGGANGGEQDMAPAESSTIVDKTFGYKDWDITHMLREWVNNPSTNLGLMLNADTTAASDSNRDFRPSENSNQDQRPILTIKCCGIGEVPSAPTGLKAND